MKSITSSILNTLTAVLLLFAAYSPSAAQGESSRISHRFSVDPSTAISVSNKFGDVHVNTWDGNAVELEVIIKAEARTPSRSSDAINQIRINIEDRIAKGLLSFTTEIGRIQSNVNFSVDYTLSVPRTNRLTLNNEFGNIYLQDHSGNLAIELKYGQLITEALEGQTEISLQFGKGQSEVQSLKGGRVDAKYSKLLLPSVAELDLVSQFSEIKIDRSQRLRIDARYGKVSVGEVASFGGNLEFTGLEIGALLRTIDIRVKHGNDIRIDRISRDFEKIAIDAEFSSVDLMFEPAASCRFVIDMQFGTLKSDEKGFNFNRITTDPKQSHYEGHFGAEPHRASISGNFRYGNLRMGFLSNK